MGRNTSVSLGDYFEGFVESRIAEGRFKNASEVIRAGLRLLEGKENRVTALRNAIRDGSNSGMAKDFNPEQHPAQPKARKKRNG